MSAPEYQRAITQPFERAGEWFDQLRALARGLGEDARRIGGERAAPWREAARSLEDDARRALQDAVDDLRRSSDPAVAQRAEALVVRVQGEGGASPQLLLFEPKSVRPGTYDDPGKRLEMLVRTSPHIRDADELLDIMEAALTSDWPPLASAPPSSDFSEAELDVLSRIGADVDAPPRDDPHHSGRTAYARMLAQALTTEEAARRLGVDTSRVYQRLSRSTLYGVRVGRQWRLPAFQFTDDGEVPDVGRVLAALPERMHPLSVLGWFTTPKDDLRGAEGGRPQSPRDWLLSGGDLAAVERLAAAEAVPL